MTEEENEMLELILEIGNPDLAKQIRDKAVEMTKAYHQHKLQQLREKVEELNASALKPVEISGIGTIKDMSASKAYQNVLNMIDATKD